MIYVGGFIFFILLIRFVVALVNLCSALYLPKAILKGQPLLSVLIPARNEEASLPRLLASIEKQQYTNYEVVIYNDLSTDDTQQVIDDHKANNNCIKSLYGKDVPKGWTGKNHACHCLAQQAKGDHYLFLDADVWLEDPSFFGKALSYMQKKQLSLLSVFPHQIMKTTGEKLTVPVMNWILLSFLPLFLVRATRWKAFSAANGQMMMFNATHYKKYQWHEQARNQLAEDIIIMRKIKKKKKAREERRAATLLGNHDICCRMYSCWKEGVFGFSKNVNEFFGGQILIMLFFTFYFLTAIFIIWVTLPIQFVYLFLLLSIFLRVFISFKSKQPVMINIFYHILQLFSFVFIVLTSIKNKSKNKFVWKGREIKAS